MNAKTTTRKTRPGQGKRLDHGKTFQTFAIEFAIAADNIYRTITGSVKLDKAAAANTKPAPNPGETEHSPGT